MIQYKTISHNSLSIVVLGDTGSGKSSLINVLMNKQIAKVGDDLDGVTKEITEYKTRLGLNNLELVLYDVPGFGNIDISTEELTKQWTSNFSNKKIDVIFYCHRISNCRMAETTRNGLKIFTDNMKNQMIEKQIFIVVTQVDLKTQEEVQIFKNEFLQQQLVPKLLEQAKDFKINQVLYTSINEKVQTICDLFLKHLSQELVLNTIYSNKISILVIGAAGSGKSSLINLLMNKDIAKVGDDLDGVTKEITEYKTRLGLNNLELVLYDVPGFGDIDVNLDELTQQWNSKLANNKIDLIFFCHQISNSRMDMITRVGLDIMIKSLRNPVIEQTFVIVVTQVDQKSQKEIDEFKSNFLQKQLIPKLKLLVSASEINKIIYSSNKKQKKQEQIISAVETIQAVEKICLQYLNENQILRVGLLGNNQSGKTDFINQFLLQKIQQQKQIQMIQIHFTNLQINQLQIEFVDIQFYRETTQQELSKKWFQLYRSKKLHLLILFINQFEENMDILQDIHLEKYQEILEQKQLNQSYYIFVNPNIPQNDVKLKQYKIQEYLKKNKTSILQKNQLIFKLQEDKVLQKNFQVCVDLYEKAREELKNLQAKTIKRENIKQSQESYQKNTGNDCISLTGRILTDKGYINISQIQKGQIILVRQNCQLNTDKIVAIIHKNHKQQTKFIKIIFQNQEYITLTPNHLLKAKFVKIGDLIERDDGKVLYPDQVQEIQYVYEEGYTCPLSSFGQLIINGCVVSCYSNCSQMVGDIFTWPIRNFQIIRNLFKQNEDSEQIHPYFKFLLSINKRIKMVKEEQ